MVNVKETTQSRFEFSPRLRADESYLRRSFKPWPEEMQRRRNVDLEKKYPGITHVMHELVRLIPWERGENITEFPVAAAVVKPITREDIEGKPYQTLEIIAKGLNQVKHKRNPDQHAELSVAEDALKILQAEHLPAECIVVSTVEPCMMCAGFIGNTDGRLVIFGATQQDLRGKEVFVNGVYKSFRAENYDYKCEATINRHKQDTAHKAIVEGGCCRNEILNRMFIRGIIHNLKQPITSGSNQEEHEDMRRAHLDYYRRDELKKDGKLPEDPPGRNLDRNQTRLKKNGKGQSNISFTKTNPFFLYPSSNEKIQSAFVNFAAAIT